MKSDAPVATVSPESTVVLLRFSPDDSRLAVAAFDGVVEIRTVPGGAVQQRVKLGPENGVGKNIESMEFTEDGASLVVAWGNGTVTEIPMSGSARADRVQTPERNYQRVSPNAKYFVQRGKSGSGVPPAETIDLHERSGRRIASLPTRTFAQEVVFAPNEEYFAGHIADDTLGVWTTAAGAQILRMPADRGSGTFTISPDSRFLATAAGPQIVVWDVAARKTVRAFDHFSEVRNIAFSPDSRSLLANCATLRIWSMDDGELKSLIDDENIDVRSRFTPDGKYIVSQEDRTLGGATPYLSFRLWRPEDLIAEGCRRATRNLDDTEWRQYLHSEPKHQDVALLP